jgi:hypothetical protein
VHTRPSPQVDKLDTSEKTSRNSILFQDTEVDSPRAVQNFDEHVRGKSLCPPLFQRKCDHCARIEGHIRGAWATFGEMHRHVRSKDGTGDGALESGQQFDGFGDAARRDINALVGCDGADAARDRHGRAPPVDNSRRVLFVVVVGWSSQE